HRSCLSNTGGRATTVRKTAPGWLAQDISAGGLGRQVATRSACRSRPYCGSHDPFRDAQRRWVTNHMRGPTPKGPPSGDVNRFLALARELVGEGAAVLITFGPPATRAALAETATIPIVAVMDLVGSGIAASMASPGGNVTGVHIHNAELDVQRSPYG